MPGRIRKLTCKLVNADDAAGFGDLLQHQADGRRRSCPRQTWEYTVQKISRLFFQGFKTGQVFRDDRGIFAGEGKAEHLVEQSCRGQSPVPADGSGRKPENSRKPAASKRSSGWVPGQFENIRTSPLKSDFRTLFSVFYPCVKKLVSIAGMSIGELVSI